MKTVDRFEWWRDAKGKYKWRIVAVNNEIVATGAHQGHSRKIDMMAAIELVRGLNARTPIKQR